MKRIFILLILLILTGNTSVFSLNDTIAKDSLLKALSTMPADSTRLETLYSLAYLDIMSPSCIYYSEKLLKEAKEQGNKKYQCLAIYSHVIYYYNHQDEENTEIWMNKLSEIALSNKYYSMYFTGKRAEITMHIIKQKIEYSITLAEDMYKLAQKLDYTEGMSAAKLCLMTAYLMTGRYKEGNEAGLEAYRLLPHNASLEARKAVLQEIVLNCSLIKKEVFFQYLQEYKTTLDRLSEKQQDKFAYKGGYLLMESLFANYYLDEGEIDEARKHLKQMDIYFSPTSFVPSRGLYYHVYSRYYHVIQEYDKALACSDSAISLLSEVSDYDGLNYKINQASILADAGRLDEAIPLFQEMLAKKDSFYRNLSNSQLEEIYQMHNMDTLLLEKEQHKEIIHYIELSLIAIALLILIPSTIRIYYVRKKLKQEEKEIREMSLIAEEANEVKNRFLINMSYNIRIPLNNILGFTQLMTMDAKNIDEHEWKEYSEIVQSNSVELIQLVNDVLDLSRLEAGRTKWQIKDYDIVILCQDAISAVRMKCENKIQINFHTEIESQTVKIDINRFTQLILSTLIYSDPCEKKRTVSFYLDRDREKELLIFRVANSPLADPELQTTNVEVRHNINRLTIKYFQGTYTIVPNTSEGPTIVITYPYSGINNA